MQAFPDPPDDEATLQILGRIEAGDREAWEELYRRYHDRLLFVVRMRLGRRLRGHLQSEDVLQSVVLEAFQALRSFEYRGPGSLQRFLQKMVTNKIRDLADTYGAEKRAGAVQLDEELARLVPQRGSGDEPAYYETEVYERLERCLAALPDEMRDLVLLRKVDGLSSKEVSERTGKSDAAVRKAYSRALARLATSMASAGTAASGGEPTVDDRS